MIEGVIKTRLSRIADDRGFLTEILRCDDPHFVKFGQVYVTTGRKGVIKAWHAHRLQTDNFYVIKGTAKIGLHDDREESPTKGEYMQVALGEEGKDARLTIPPFVWHGFMSLSQMCYVLNVVSEPYNRENPDELRVPIEAFEDIWTIKNR